MSDVIEKVAATTQDAIMQLVGPPVTDAIANEITGRIILALADNVTDEMVEAARRENQGHATTESVRDVIRAEIVAALRAVTDKGET